MKKKLVSVVVVTKDRRKDLEECVTSFVNSDYKPLEIIVVDNNSANPVHNWIAKKFKDIKVITLKENVGAAEGRNMGLSESRGEYILFTDDDAYAASNMVAELVKVFENKKRAGIVQPLVYDKQKKNYLQGAGHDISLWTGRITAWGVKEKDVGQYQGIREVPMCGCVWMVKKEVFQKIGNYDEDYFIPYEDSDFSLRGRKAGYKLYCVSLAKTWHQGVKKTFVHPWVEWLGITSPERGYRVARNKIIFIRKNSSISQNLFFHFFMLPIYILLHTSIILVSGRTDIFIKYIKGVLSGIIYNPSLRKSIDRKNTFDSKPLIDTKFKLNKYPPVSIIVPVKNPYNYMEKFINSISGLNYPNIEIVVIDDLSSDNAESYTKSRFKKISKYRLLYIKNKKMQGIAESRNIGIKKAKGKYIAFAEVDMAFDKDWLNNIVSFLEMNSSNNIAGATPKIMDYFKRKIINSCGTLIIPQTAWVIPVNVGMKEAKINDDIYPSIVTGVGSVVNKNALIKINGFDGKLMRNVEDIDLGWRMWIAGFRTFHYPYAKVYHYTSKDMRTRKDISVFRQQFHMTKSLRLIYKNYEVKNLIKFLPMSFLINFLRILINIRKADFYSAGGILYGMGWFLFTLFDSQREKKKISKYRKSSDMYLIKNIMVSGSFYDIYKNKLANILEISKKFSQNKIT